MRSPRTGLTLIEVLAAVSLLATLLGMVVVGSTRHTRQLRLAQDRLAAQQIADALLEQWLIDQGGLIEEPRGGVPGHPTWEWRLSGLFDEGLQPLGLHVGRLDIVRIPDASERLQTTAPIVLARVEFASSSIVTAEAAARGTP